MVGTFEGCVHITLEADAAVFILFRAAFMTHVRWPNGVCLSLGSLCQEMHTNQQARTSSQRRVYSRWSKEETDLFIKLTNKVRAVVELMPSSRVLDAHCMPKIRQSCNAGM